MMASIASPEVSAKFYKKFRLLRRGDFRRVSSKGRRYFGRYLLIEACNSSREGPRLGITASRHFAPSVQRNFFKRQVREAFRTLRGSLPIHLDINVKPRKYALHASSSQLKEELSYLIKSWLSDENSL
jgi:ribonuclease P protein component